MGNPRNGKTHAPSFPSTPWAEKVGNNSNIAARRETLQEKDTGRETRLGEDLRKQVVEFVGKGAAGFTACTTYTYRNRDAERTNRDTLDGSTAHGKST